MNISHSIQKIRVPSLPNVSLLITSIFIIFFPLLVDYIYVDYIKESEINSRLAWLLVIAGFSYILPYKKLYVIPLIAFLLSGALDIVYATSFSGIYTTAAIEAMALTDTQEAIEFIPSYLNMHNFIATVFYLTLGITLIVKAQAKKSSHWAHKVIFALAVVVFIAILHLTINKQKYGNAMPGFMGTLPNYLKSAEGVDQIISKRKKVVEATQHTASIRSDKPQTYIIVVGESLARRHMSLYDYTRETSTNLTAISNELEIFTDVISSHSQTQASLRLALTEASTTSKKPYSQALSILDTANLAGFKTWWISNQQPMRATIASISNMADKKHYISNDFHGVENNRYDGLLLPSIKDALQDTAQHKVIFVHLMGSHIRYKHRFPKSFAHFTEEPTLAYTDDLSEKQMDQINKYDNSVRYNDFVISEMINLLKEHNIAESKKQISGLMMFSDHGEDVYDTRNFRGHAPDDRASAPMFEIPLVYWLSGGYKEEFLLSYQQAKLNLNTPYMTDDLYHMALDFIAIDSDTYNGENSLMSNLYKPKKRMVYRKDYDRDFNLQLACNDPCKN